MYVTIYHILFHITHTYIYMWLCQYMKQIPILGFSLWLSMLSFLFFCIGMRYISVCIYTYTRIRGCKACLSSLSSPILRPPKASLQATIPTPRPGPFAVCMKHEAWHTRERTDSGWLGSWPQQRTILLAAGSTRQTRDAAGRAWSPQL